MSFVAVSVTAGLGIGQAVLGGIKSHKAQKALQNQQTPVYQPNQAINQYYQQALNKATTSPYNSQFYQNAQNQANRGMATGIGALQDRRSAIGGVSTLVQGNEDSLDKAGAEAEGQQRQAMGQLGQATGMKSGDDKFAFDQNEMLPYDQKRGIFQAQAQGGNQMENAGISNIGGAMNSFSQNQMYKGMFSGRGNSIMSAGGGGGGYSGANSNAYPSNMGSILGMAGQSMGGY